MEAKGQVVANTPIYYKDKEARDLLGEEELETTDQTCTGAINELKGTLDYKTFESITYNTVRLTNVDGGYVRKGTTIYLMITFDGIFSATNSPVIGSITTHKPLVNTVLSCIDITNGLLTGIEESIPCAIATNGQIIMKKLTNGNKYAISGCYISADD